jgi:hypothetical protein
MTLMIALVAAAGVSATAWARDWQDGDVFVGLSNGTYNVYDNGGTLHETITQGGGGFAVNCAFDRSGVLHTTAFTTQQLIRFVLPHPHNQLPVIPLTSGGPESVSFARDGSFYVGHQVNPNSLRKFTGAGTLLTNFTPESPATLIDLSSDQRTMFYTSRSGSTTQVGRFDVVANTNLPDFAELAGGQPTADMKLLPPGDGSGGLLVAQTTIIKRLDGSGNVIGTYDVAGEESWFGIALDPNGTSFWAQTNSPGSVYRFNLASGAVERGPLPSAASAFGICVKGTRTAALDNAPPSIQISTPANGTTFTLGQVVPAAYSCADDANGTGIASCSGPVAPNAGIDTSTPGPKTFTVNAADVAGNTASASTTYTVAVPPPPPPPPSEITSTVSHNWSVLGRRTTMLQLLARRVPQGARVQIRCRGRRCPFKRKNITARRAGNVNIARRLNRRQRRVRAGQRLEVRITKAGFIGRYVRYTIRNNKLPTRIVRCMPAGSTRPQRRC